MKRSLFFLVLFVQSLFVFSLSDAPKFYSHLNLTIYSSESKYYFLK